MAGVVDTAYYDFLGVPVDADKRQLRLAYLKLAKAFHPDQQGGDSGMMQELVRIYNILKDDTKRALYDQQGVAAFEARENEGADTSARAQLLADVGSLLSTTFQQAIGQLMLQPGSNPLMTTRYLLAEQKKNCLSAIDQLPGAIKQLEELLESLQFNGSAEAEFDGEEAEALKDDRPDLLGASLRLGLEFAQYQKAMHEQRLRLIQVAMVYLNHYTWKPKPQPPVPTVRKQDVHGIYRGHV